MFGSKCLYRGDIRMPKSPQKFVDLHVALAQLLSQVVIAIFPEKVRFQGFYFNLLTIPKVKWSICPILDLKVVNAFLWVQKCM